MAHGLASGPDQIALEQFHAKPVACATSRSESLSGSTASPDRRRKTYGRGKPSAIRPVIRYRNGVLNGKGASLLDGYMEDLATDRIYRLIWYNASNTRVQRPFVDDAAVRFCILRNCKASFSMKSSKDWCTHPPRGESGTPETLRDARRIAEAMILNQRI